MRNIQTLLQLFRSVSYQLSLALRSDVAQQRLIRKFIVACITSLLGVAGHVTSGCNCEGFVDKVVQVVILQLQSNLRLFLARFRNVADKFLGSSNLLLDWVFQ